MANRNQINFGDSSLTIRPRGLDKLWGFRSSIEVPYDAINAVHADATRPPIGFASRIGLDTGLKRSGRFYTGSEKMFLNVSGSGPTLRIDLHPGFEFDKIILSIDDPDRFALQINRNLQNTQSSDCEPRD